MHRDGPKKEQYFKVILIGDAAVGKSSMVRNYVTANFSKEYHVTIGVEFASREVKLEDGHVTKIQIWDAAGQECFRSIVRSFYRNAAAFILVYNLASTDSFKNLLYWIQDARDNQMDNSLFILVANQCDREEERQVNYEEASRFAKENNFDLFFEVSAKTGKNVEHMFLQIAELLYVKSKDNLIAPNEKKGDTAVLKANKTTDEAAAKTRRGCSC